MLKNIVFIFISLAFITACDSGSRSNSATSPLEKGKIYLAEANKLRVEGDDLASKKIYKKAVAAFENAAREDANQKGLACLLGQSQYRLRDFDNAIQWLKKAIAQDKTDVESTQYMGYCLINKTKIQEAEATFKKAVHLDPSGVAKQAITAELTDIGKLSLSLGENFTSQGNPKHGTEFKKLGMRILAMALDFSEYDMTLAKEIQGYANEMQDQILKDWISNIIAKGGKNVIEVDF